MIALSLFRSLTIVLAKSQSFAGSIYPVIPKYEGGETLEQAIANLDRYDILNYSEDVYKNWFTTANTTTFSWYTSGGGSNPGHLLMEVG